MIDQTAALSQALKRRPDVTIGQPHAFDLATAPMDRDWIARFDAAEPARQAGNPARQAQRERLIAALIAFGGQRACVASFEEDLDKILARGRLFAGKARRSPGRPCRCHANVCRLAEENPGAFLIATGYALSDDGMWRQHSWGFLIRARSSQLIETTEPRIAYFGYVMEPREAAAFCADNF